MNWRWCGSGNVVRSKTEAAACAIPPAPVGRPAYRGPPVGRGRDVAGARGLLGPRAPRGAVFRPPAAASGDYGSGNVVGCASVSISARFARFGGRYAPPPALNYVKLRCGGKPRWKAHSPLNFPVHLSLIFALLLSRFFVYYGILPRLLRRSFGRVPAMFRHFAVCRNLPTFAPSLQYRVPAIPAGDMAHEVVRRP